MYMDVCGNKYSTVFDEGPSTDIITRNNPIEVYPLVISELAPSNDTALDPTTITKKATACVMHTKNLGIKNHVHQLHYIPITHGSCKLTIRVLACQFCFSLHCMVSAYSYVLLAEVYYQ